MLSKPEEHFSVLPTLKIQPQEQLEEISAFKSVEMFATDQIQLTLPTDKSDFGSNKKNNANGKATLMNGFMNDLTHVLFILKDSQTLFYLL
jgi:hypothetical protein